MFFNEIAGHDLHEWKDSHFHWRICRIFSMQQTDGVFTRTSFETWLDGAIVAMKIYMFSDNVFFLSIFGCCYCCRSDKQWRRSYHKFKVIWVFFLRATKQQIVDPNLNGRQTGGRMDGRSDGWGARKLMWRNKLARPRAQSNSSIHLSGWLTGFV